MATGNHLQAIQRVANDNGVLLPAERAIRVRAPLKVVDVPEESLIGSLGGEGEVTGYTELSLDDGSELFCLGLDAGGGELVEVGDITMSDGARTITVAQKGATGATAGAALSIVGQTGQDQTGGANNNNGGAVDLVGGEPGTGGSGTAGLPGAAGLRASTLRFAVASVPPSFSGCILYDVGNEGFPYFAVNLEEKLMKLGNGIEQLGLGEGTVPGVGQAGMLLLVWDGTDLKGILPDGTTKTFTWT